MSKSGVGNNPPVKEGPCYDIVKDLIKQFKTLKRSYKNIGEATLSDELTKNTNTLVGYMTD